MDLRKLKTLIDLVSESNVSELEITEAECKVRIVKAGAMHISSPGAVAYAQPVTQLTTVAAPVLTGGQPPIPKPEDELKGIVVKSPMVGTFYRSASPGGQPFVEVGTAVKQGDTLCIVEAMKILNEINAEQVGTVARILVENAQPVEYGQPLFILE
jgi:acetyl-CoA carboxylase biotin carboxyl carrier protein